MPVAAQRWRWGGRLEDDGPRDRASRIYKVEREPLESATRRLAPEHDVAPRSSLARYEDTARQREQEREREKRINHAGGT